MKEYELSLNRNYVSSWGIKEAIRELIQNAFDQENEDIIFNKDNIEITNYNISIPSSTLVLGNSTKRDDDTKVGCYGEGFKLAILVLLRLGCNIEILNGDKKWLPKFKYSSNFNTEILCIDETENDGTDLSFIIRDIDNYIINELKDEFVGIANEVYKSIKTHYGEILLDDKFKGRMFVNGLPIMKDEKFKFGYNFKPEYVQLDRDRKSINLRELYEICAKAITTMENPDYSLLDKLIDGGTEDARYLIDRNINLRDEFINDYSKHLNQRFNIDDKTVIVGKNSSEIIEELEKRKNRGEDINIVKTEKVIYADVLNRVNSFSANILNSVHNDITTKSNLEKAYDNYEDSSYQKLLEWFYENMNQPTNEEFNVFLELIEDLEPSYFDLIKKEVIKELKERKKV